MLWARMARALRAVVAGERAWLPNPCCRIADSAPENCPSTGCPVAMVGHEQREAAPRRINRRMLMVRNWRPQSSSFSLDGRHSEAIQDWPFRTDSPFFVEV